MMKLWRETKGQSTVEYVLLLSVVMLLILVVLRTPAFKNFLGKDSPFFRLLKYRFVYTYCYAGDGLISPISVSPPKKCHEPGYDYGTVTSHQSYSNTTTGESRFFSGKEKYPP